MKKLKKDKMLSIAILLLGLSSIITCRIQVMAIVLALATIVLAVMQIRKKQCKGLSIAGIELAVIGFSYSFIISIIENAISRVF